MIQVECSVMLRATGDSAAEKAGPIVAAVVVVLNDSYKNISTSFHILPDRQPGRDSERQMTGPWQPAAPTALVSAVGTRGPALTGGSESDSPTRTRAGDSDSSRRLGLCSPAPSKPGRAVDPLSNSKARPDTRPRPRAIARGPGAEPTAKPRRAGPFPPPRQPQAPAAVPAAAARGAVCHGVTGAAGAAGRTRSA